MTMEIHKLAVIHADRTESGDKIEPEEQTVVQIGSAPVHVNLGTADFEHKNGGRPIITRESIGVLRHAGSFQRATSANVAAQEAHRRCDLCKYFDLEALQSTSRNAHADDTRTAIAKGLFERGHCINLKAAEAQARLFGQCRYSGLIATPSDRCERFTPASHARKGIALSWDDMMKAARGRFWW